MRQASPILRSPNRCHRFTEVAGHLVVKLLLRLQMLKAGTKSSKPLPSFEDILTIVKKCKLKWYGYGVRSKEHAKTFYGVQYDD